MPLWMQRSNYWPQRATAWYRLPALPVRMRGSPLSCNPRASFARLGPRKGGGSMTSVLTLHCMTTSGYAAAQLPRLSQEGAGGRVPSPLRGRAKEGVPKLIDRARQAQRSFALSHSLVTLLETPPLVSQRASSARRKKQRRKERRQVHGAYKASSEAIHGSAR